MGRRKTPIEWLAEGNSTDRQKRYEARKREAGFTRVTEWVPTDRVAEFKAMAREWVASEGWEGQDHD